MTTYNPNDFYPSSDAKVESDGNVANPPYNQYIGVIRLDKEKVLGIFYELLEAWEDSECIAIHDRGDIDDFEELRFKKENYKQEFLKALNKN